VIIYAAETENTSLNGNRVSTDDHCSDVSICGGGKIGGGKIGGDTEHARTALLEEINRRVGALAPPLYKGRDAIPLLQKRGLTRKQSRRVIEAGDGSKWRLVRLAGERGTPVAVLPIGHDFVAIRGYIKVSALFEYSPLRRPLGMHAAESGEFGPVEPTNVTPDPLSVAGSNYKGGGGTKPGTEEDLKSKPPASHSGSRKSG
jgi:hypothetical protein